MKKGAKARTIYLTIWIENIKIKVGWVGEIFLEFVEVDAELDISSNNRILLKNPLSTEQILTKARIKEIENHIDKLGFTIIYTEYVGKDIIKNLSNAIKDLGLNYAFHIGSDHTRKKLFQEKKTQVFSFVIVKSHLLCSLCLQMIVILTIIGIIIFTSTLLQWDMFYRIYFSFYRWRPFL